MHAGELSSFASFHRIQNMATRILITDRTRFTRELLAGILGRCGFDVVGEAKSGRECVDLFRSLKPDVVLVDFAMPEMDGVATLKQIRAIDASAAVVMCAAVGKPRRIRDAIQAGAKDIVSKPYRASEVNRAVLAAVGG